MIEGLSQKRTKRVTDASENAIQKSIIEWMRATNAHKKGWLFYHIPNGGSGQTTGQKIHNWKMGVLGGVADIGITSPTSRSMYIEVKTPSGKLEPHQKGFKEHCDKYKIRCETARSLDDAILILNAWGFPNG